MEDINGGIFAFISQLFILSVPQRVYDHSGG
jgi:hypothetical protein